MSVIGSTIKMKKWKKTPQNPPNHTLPLRDPFEDIQTKSGRIENDTPVKWHLGKSKCSHNLYLT